MRPWSPSATAAPTATATIAARALSHAGRRVPRAAPNAPEATMIATKPTMKSGDSRALLSKPPASAMATPFAPHATTAVIAAMIETRAADTR